jgi:GST-like protein
MIDLYTFGTPNGRKVSIALEEMALDYKVHTINIQKDEQFSKAFLKISPNNKIPAIVDHETGVSMMESGAILYYLATKSGKFMPKDPARHWQAIEWLNWQIGGFGPMLGQAHHFLKYNPGLSAEF